MPEPFANNWNYKILLKKIYQDLSLLPSLYVHLKNMYISKTGVES
uniref:Macaca fascicularis brain cDNA, clone: QflA-23417 n=1 Tax=Macaca fascicularis TaxID=9541 RepID=I7GIX3_MACFA|nr:unnamed protein product [Macaca fascicularis]